MSLKEALKGYYALFGLRGIVLAACARAADTYMPAEVDVPGLKHPLIIRLRTSDVSVFNQVFVIAEYAFSLTKEPRIIVDAGANIGLTAAFYANEYPEAKIFALEPEPSNFIVLERNAEKYHNIVTVKAALWNANTSLDLIDPGLGHYGFQATASVDAGMKQHLVARTKAMTLDKLMEQYSIDYIDILKVDIEASEKEVFDDSSSWIDRVGVIVVEVHDNLKPGCQEAVEKATAGFPIRVRNGETFCIARQEYGKASNMLPPSLNIGSGAKLPRAHFKIARAEPLPIMS